MSNCQNVNKGSVCEDNPTDKGAKEASIYEWYQQMTVIQCLVTSAPLKLLLNDQPSNAYCVTQLLTINNPVYVNMLHLKYLWGYIVIREWCRSLYNH
jgi:hypothetical protein